MRALIVSELSEYELSGLEPRRSSVRSMTELKLPATTTGPEIEGDRDTRLRKRSLEGLRLGAYNEAI